MTNEAQHQPEALRIADDLGDVISPDYHDVVQDAASELRSLHAENLLLKAEGASYLEQYTAIRAERDAVIASHGPMPTEKRGAFGAAARPLIEFLNNLHPHHVVHVTATGAELFEGQVTYKTSEFLKD